MSAATTRFYAVYRSGSIRREIIALFDDEEEALSTAKFRRDLGDSDCRWYYSVLEAELFSNADEYRDEYLLAHPELDEVDT